MDYLKIYKNIIDKAKNREIDKFEYYEKHHIIPKSLMNNSYCIGILNEYYIVGLTKKTKSNIVKLTLREHYISHLLLVRIFSNNKDCYNKMLHAANFLTNRTDNSKQYAWQKTEYFKMLKETMKGKPSRAKGKKWSEEAKKNKSGINHVMKGKTYEELYGTEEANRLKKLRGENRIGKKWDNKIIQKFKNRQFSVETRNKISISKKGIPLKEETKIKLSEFFSNRDLNPHVIQTQYLFYHIDGGVEKCRKIDMKDKHGIKNINKIICGVRQTCKGWCYKGENSENGFTITDVVYKLDKDIEDKIISDYTTNKLRISDIAQKLNIHNDEVSAVLYYNDIIIKNSNP